VFVADGEWEANDYKQQEYKLTAHFAALCRVRGGAEAVRAYEQNPNLDFHQMVADMTGLPRGLAKIQNFALLYGQGLAATAHKLGMTEDEARDLRDKVSKEAPFGPALDEYLRNAAQRKGYLILLDGARVRFDDWEAAWVDREEQVRGYREQRPMNPCGRDEAIRRRGDPDHPWFGARLRRAGVRKALNRQVQGSAARQTKMAMREARRRGVTFLMQMHDELDVDIQNESERGVMAEVMATCVPGLLVPMSVDVGYGRNWAEAKLKGK
jgi:DNA polymerase I-like protein with 3'-5' exonuclease and polymerase domains